MEDSRYHIQLEVFEGPMDLLYHLIRKSEVDIYDIPISDITDQYLEYIRVMKAMNIDLAGEFLVMAATLMHIKSRMLLPRHEELGEDEDPRLEIVRPLAEYLQFKEAAEQMSKRPLLGDSVFARKPDPAEIEEAEQDPTIVAGLFELIDAFAGILEKNTGEDLLTVTAETVSVKERISEIASILEKAQTATFDELFEGQVTRIDVVVTFLAILEMVKLSVVRVVQHTQSGILRIFYD